jgi:hypothetical protein
MQMGFIELMKRAFYSKACRPKHIPAKDLVALPGIEPGFED